MQRSLLLFVALLSAVFPALAEPVLIVPFFCQSPEANAEWIGESIAHTVQEALVSRGILVLDRGERETVYRRLALRQNAHLTLASVIKVAEEIDAGYVVFGEYEVTTSADGKRMLSINTKTLDMRRLRKSGQFVDSGPLDDLAHLQSRLAWQVLKELAPDLAPSADEFQRAQPSIRLDAMENYTRGLMSANPEMRHRYFTQSARLDERFSEPMYELGQLYLEKEEYRLAAGWLEKVTPAAPRYMEAMFRLGLCRFELGDYAGAQAALEVVAASVPLNEVFNNLGVAQLRRNLPEALENLEKAVEGDSADPDYQFNAGYALWKAGRYDQAAERFRSVLNLDPEDPEATTMLGRCLARSGPARNEAGGLERLKENYEEGAYRQLKAAMEGLRRR